MTRHLTLIALFLGLTLALPQMAVADDVVILGGRYVGNKMGKKNFNTPQNEFSAMTPGPTAAEDMRRQFYANGDAYRNQAKTPGVKVEMQKPLLRQVDEKKAHCLTGNYDDCR